MTWWQKLKKYIKKNPHVWWALFMPVYMAAFFWAEGFVTPEKGYWVSHLPLDDLIPFVPEFIVAYCLWFPFLIGTGLFLMLRDGDGFRRYVRFLAIGFFGTLAFCLLFPNGQDMRPAAFTEDTVFTWLVGRIYAADTNTNVFPSMHVIGAFGAAAAVCHDRTLRRYGVWAVALAVLISASTVFVKQHSLLDVIGGAAVSAVLYLAIYRRKRT